MIANNPFGDDEKGGYFTRIMSLKVMHCKEEKLRVKQSLRFLVEFPHNTSINTIPPFNYKTTLIGEGSWDKKKSRLRIAACRLLNPAGYTLANTHVGDCSFRLSLEFPATWTIRNATTIVGNLWTPKDVTSPGYFPTIKLQSFGFDLVVPGVRYKYTEINGMVRHLCPYQKQHGNNNHQYWKYPNGYSE